MDTRQALFRKYVLAGAAALAAAAAPQPAHPAAAPAAAQQMANWIGAAESGVLVLQPRDGTPITAGLTLETRVDISISGLLARASVSQRFLNPGPDWAEGVYVFPLPHDAAVDHMRLRVDGRVIEGQIRERQEARAIYERAKREGRRSGLVQQERPNVFMTSVANIPPGSEIEVEVEYQQSVRFDDGVLSLRLPTVVAPRYDRELGDASGYDPPVRPMTLRAAADQGVANQLSISIDLAPGFPLDTIDSPYHEIDVVDEAGRYWIELADGVARANRDFELRWTALPGHEPRAALFTETYDGDTYALLMLMPPDGTRAIGPAREPLAREVIWVIDTSGSMAGESIEQARRALELALDRLGPRDSFNLIQFDNTTRSLFPDARTASSANLSHARSWVKGLRADGGTELLTALEFAMRDRSPEADELRQIVFLTDGGVSNESAISAAIARGLGRSRLFCVGIGAAPNGHLMQRLAELGRGSFTHIGSSEEISERMQALARKLESAALTDLELVLPGNSRASVFPDPIPDLYAGEPVLIKLALPEPLDWVGVRGRRGDDVWSATADHRDAVERPGLHVLWARGHIGALMQQRAVSSDTLTRDALREQVVDTALYHHLVSAFTSLVAVDVTPLRRDSDPLRRSPVPAEKPATGTQQLYAMANTASGADLYLWLGGLLALAGLAVLRVRSA